MLRIGEFSKLAKTTVKTLRFYDEIDLFKPNVVDDNGYRYYSPESLGELQLIVELRSYGIPIDDIRKILKFNNVKEVLENRKNEIESELARSRENLSLINEMIQKYEEGVFMEKYQAKEIIIPEQIVYYRHGIIPVISDINKFVLEAGAECAANNPDLKCTGYCFVTYEAKEYQEKDVELEFAEALNGFGKESQNIKFKKLEECKAICVQHRGSYQKLGEAYAFAVNWVKDNGYEIADKIRECYIHGCWDRKDEKDYLTEIQIPVK